MRRLLLSAALLALLAACGTRGNLVLPPPPDGTSATPVPAPVVPVDNISKPVMGAPR